MTRARQVANFDPALFAADEVSGDKVSGGTIGGSTVVNTSGAITTTGGLTVGVDGTGQDVKFFADDSGSFMNWDESENTLEIRGGGEAYGIAEGKLLLSSAEASIVQGNKLGQIDFQAPLENTGGTTGDQRLVGASIWAVADNTFSSTVNETELVFALGNSETAVEKMRLTKKGALRLDHSSPQNTSNMDTHAIEVVRVPNDDAAELNISFLHNAPSGYTSSGDHLGGILFGGASQGGTVYHGLAAIKANASAPWATGGSGDAPAELTFHTTPDGSVTPAERMVITKEGNVGINVDPASTTRFYVDGIGNDGNTNCMVLRNGSNTNLLYITDGGYTWAYQSWTTSDSRKKKNISYITEDILPKIENLKFAKFDMTETELKNCYGFIAQDVETIFPDCIDIRKMPDTDILYESGDEIPEGKEIGDVKEEGEEQKNLNYNYLFSHLVKAVQELSAKVTALESA